MFNKKTMVLYCGGAPTMAPNAPASPGGGVVGGGSGGGGNNGSVTPGASSPLVSLMGGGPSWGANGFCEGPRALIGGGPRAGPLARIGPWEAPPRALIGPAAAAEQPLWRPGTLALPEGELDGCEPDSEDGEAEATVVPSPTASLESVSSEAEKEMAAEAEGGDAGASPDLLQDGLRRMTLEVVGRYLREAADGGAKGGGGGAKFALQGFLGRFGGSPAEAEVAQALETLRRVGESLLEKHQLAFQGMLRKMEIKKEDDLKTISEVAKEVFRDGIVNWGRIVTLISFGAFVAKHLKSINQENGINTLIEIITDVLVTDKREWLVKHNAWEGFVQFFHVEDIEGGIRNVLMAFASVAGIGASLAYMIR